jgi:hypothetical protein
MWIYKQSTGQLYKNSALIGTGYAGRDNGKNNPAMQGIKGVGPIPCGLYVIDRAEDRADTGPLSIKLNPDSANEMFGRSSFFIHGDSKENPGEASHGCLIQSREIRKKILFSDDKILNVVGILTMISTSEFVSLFPTEIMPYIGLGIGIGNLILRTFTTTPIGQSSGN